MNGITTDFNKVAADLRSVLPDLTEPALAACGLNTADIPAADFRLWDNIRRETNCHSFAMDVSQGYYNFPGSLSPKRPIYHHIFTDRNTSERFPDFCEIVQNALRMDGHHHIGLSLDPEKIAGRKGWLVAVFMADKEDRQKLDPDSKRNDYHFYALRRMEDNHENRMNYPRYHFPQIVWTAKSGPEKAVICRNPDIKNAQLSAPDVIFRDAQSKAYNHFGGFYLVNRFDPDALPRSKWEPSF